MAMSIATMTDNPLQPIPCPPRTKIVGNMFSVGTSEPIQSMMKLARELGPIYWLDMMGKPIVVVSGFELVNELSDETRFDKTVRGALRRIRAFAGDGLFTAYTKEPNWSKAHNILLPNFSQRAMQGYHPMMLDIAEQLMQKWQRLNSDDEIDVTNDMTSLTLDTIGLAGFDYRFNSFYRESNHPFVSAMVRALEITMQTRGLPFEDIIRKDRDLKLKYDIRYMNKTVDRIIQERRHGGEDLSARKDLLSYMLTGVDKATGERLDDLNIRNQTITFLIAGHETTSGLLSFATYFMLQNPEVLAKAYAEVDRVLGSDPSVSATYNQVNQLSYITQILKEALRLWPTAPAYSLAPFADTVIGGKYTMKPEYQIAVLIPMLHRDKSVWGDRAEVFDPEHFSREAEAARPPNAFKPFGNGQRACIGRQFAMQEAALVLGMMLQRFELVDHYRYRLKVKESLTIKPENFKIRVRPRKDLADAPIKVSTFAPATARLSANGSSALAHTSTQAAIRPSHATPLLVLYGSNLGTAEGIARDMAERGEANGFAATVAPLDEYVDRLPRTGAVLITSASYNGTPPDNALRFCDWLKNGAIAEGALQGVNFAVFGCGNRDWASTFQTVPRLIDSRLAELGATRVMARGEGDARDDFDGQFQTWYAPLWSTLAKELKIDLTAPDAGPSQHYDVEIVSVREASPFVDQLGAVAMTVVANRELQSRNGATPSDRSTRHIEMRLPDGVAYRAGDHLGVIPRNSPALVRRVAERFHLVPEARVRLTTTSGRRANLPVDQPISVSRLLGDYVELQDVASRKQVQTLAAHTHCPHAKPKLLALAAEDPAGVARYREEVFNKRRSIIDLLQEFEACELPFGVYLDMLAPLRPRYYSISSSPLAYARDCAITVAVVEGAARSGRGSYQGVCSNYLKPQAEGNVLFAFVKDTKSAFRLPANPSTPVIMVGPGTGLAPFRGFLQERAAQKAGGQAVGPAMLFFGCRSPDHDFLYSDELKGFEAQGLTQLHVAFSRMEGQRKAYVQDLILAKQDEIWDLLAKGAVIYVCGDAGKMAPAVRQAFSTVLRQKAGLDHVGAEQRLEAMAGQNRYLIDVWASG